MKWNSFSVLRKQLKRLINELARDDYFRGSVAEYWVRYFVRFEQKTACRLFGNEQSRVGRLTLGAGNDNASFAPIEQGCALLLE